MGTIHLNELNGAELDLTQLNIDALVILVNLEVFRLQAERLKDGNKLSNGRQIKKWSG